MAEAAPAGVRCTAIAPGFNVTTGIAGGLTPLVATWLVEPRPMTTARPS